MTDCIRERLIAAIVTRIGGVYGIPTPEDERDLPVTIVQDGTDTVASNYDTTVLTMSINIGRAELSTSADRATMRKQANAALAKIITDMHTDETFGGLSSSVQYTGGGIELEIGNLVFAEAGFNVTYSHLRGNPTITN